MEYEPISVALKIARSALKDLKRTASPAPDATGFHPLPAVGGSSAGGDAWLISAGGGGLSPGERFDLFGGLTIGRSQDADVQISDRYASGLHCRVFNRGSIHYLEDMRSTNGTLLNDATVDAEVPLHDGDVIRIGDTELRFEAG
jgi:hypothetical protein